MIAESQPDEMEMMITVIMNCLKFTKKSGKIFLLTIRSTNVESD